MDPCQSGVRKIDPALTLQCDVARGHLEARRLQDAERAYRAVLTRAPDFTPALLGLGEVAAVVGAHDGAIKLFRQALRIDPKLAAARTALSLSLRQLGARDEAMAELRQAIVDQPDYALAHHWLGLALLEVGDPAAAAASIERSVELQPDLIGSFGFVLYNFLQTCEWRSWDKLVRLLEEGLKGRRAIYSPMVLLLVSQSPKAILASSRLFAKTLFPPAPPLRPKAYPRRKRIRIACVSTDLHDHPVARLLVGALEAFDREAFELTAISYGPNKDSDLRRRVVSAFDTFCDLDGAGPDELTQAIAGREIDIALNLNGYTGHCRPEVFARRPAPLQVSYLGYPATMGAPYIDYLIADRHVIPPEHERFYDEKIVWMPHTYQPTDDKALIAGATPTRASQGLPQQCVVLMAYNRAHKISPLIFEAWMRILRQVPDAVLWLQAAEAVTQDNLRREAAARGVTPERLIFAPRTETYADHLARHRLADLFIDTLPYNAHATASDALWAGLPVVTCRGGSFAGRVCAGLLTAAGFPELITDTLDDYVSLAVALAADRPRLAALRARVAAQARRSQLFDTKTYARNLQAALHTMYERSQAGLPPESFAATPD
jgi:protein O-GlcNAc transferase